MSLTERLFVVRRAECRDHLIRIGQSPDLAERWLEAWEHEAERRGWESSPEFWDHGRLWIDSQIALRRNPTTAFARR